jgi:RNA polymerase sigma-70 factor, ECF subfamily
MIDTSVSLLDRIASRGSDQDWERLLRIYRPFIDKQIRRFPLLIDQADDIVQEISIVLTQELPEFQRQRTGSFRAWLKGITTHKLLNAVRKARSSPLLVGDWGQLESQLQSLEDPASSLAKEWDKEHDEEVVRTVLEIISQEVSSVHWEAFQRHSLRGVPATEVAQQLGISTTNVYAICSRITQRLRTEAAGLTQDN